MDCLKILRLVALSLLVSVLSGTSTSAEIIYVNDDAGGVDTGTSWLHAYVDLQDALGRAKSGDEIWVADGIYWPGPDGASPNVTFQLRSGVKLYGGFDGTEGSLEERAGLFCLTVLSGDLDNDDRTSGDKTDNVNHVVVGTGTDEAAELDGFTITGGYARGHGPRSFGGGLHIDGADPLSANCRIANCIFRENLGGIGGAMWVGGRNATVVVEDCEFLENEAIETGTGNDGHSGAVHAHNVGVYGSLRMERCVFRQNRSARYCGAFGNNNSGNVQIRHCSFLGNVAVREHSGAGNVAEYVNCVFSGNSAVNGRAVTVGSGTGKFIHCTFAGNVATELWGGLVVNDGKPEVEGCIFWDNRDSGSDVEAAQIYVAAGSGIIVNYSCVQGWSYTLDPNGRANTRDDPLFVESPDPNAGNYGDLRLLESSPCIDRGNKVALEQDYDVTLDLEGDPRYVDDPSVRDTGRGVPPLPDSGAFEGAHPPCNSLTLEIQPPEVVVGGSVVFEVCGGLPHAAVRLVVTSVNGASTWVPLSFFGKFDLFGRWTSPSVEIPVVPPEILGIPFGLTAFGTDASGRGTSSDEEYLTICR